MLDRIRADDTTEWLAYLQPEGLVLGPNVLRASGLTPIRQTPLDSKEYAEALGIDPDAEPTKDDQPDLELRRQREHVLQDHWRLFQDILGWPAKLVAGAPGGPPVDPALSLSVPEHGTLLSPDMALLWPGAAEDSVPAQALVMLHPTLEADGRGQFADGEWEASPHHRLERLIRETKVGVGILVARGVLRLIYAPAGETAGWISWPIGALYRPDARPMLAGLKLCLNRNAFFTGATETRLRPLLKASREAQNEVSDKLSGQVLGALHELLRGLHRADPARIEHLAEHQPKHLYEGLLTCLMRLVFLLYAEDRDLLPTSKDERLKALWESGYSIKTLYARLLADEALNPDTMDERRGGWGHLLAVFRLIHDGYPGWVARRGGKLFDPDAFPFLEARDQGTTRDVAQVAPVSDGMVLRILHGLMTVEGRSLSGEKIRERVSYRSLDVEAIGSVYETSMGFTAGLAKERMIALRDEKKLPTFVELDSLLAVKPADRQKWLKEKAVKLSAKQAAGVKAATDVDGIVEAFGSLIDERGSPGGMPIGAGAPFLQPTEERRRSGSHYTPRSLTEPIVRYALEPAFERLGVNASPEAVLALKVLDPACGSGAFLVEACRQLGKRLEQAWDMHPREKPAVPADETQDILARRLVAQKCLYGVDRNPMAVDLAKLSLWLATLAAEHEFTFLDHALKAGDSLVGLTRAEIKAANWDASKPGLPLFQQAIDKLVDEGERTREAIRTAGEDVMNEAQAARFARSQDQLEPARAVGDAVIAAFFSADKPRERERARAEVENAINGTWPPDWSLLQGRVEAFRCSVDWRPMHWEIEYPEVFRRENAGFDAIVGNPPFAGKNTISAGSGTRYLPWLQHLHVGAHGNADLVAHFFRRAFGLLRQGGAFGLIATNTIGQGDTRETGLATILRTGGAIFRAVKRYQWPNEGAAVVVSIVHVAKSRIQLSVLDGRSVERISAYLVQGFYDDTPRRLLSNGNKAFTGSTLRGVGFIFDDEGAAKGDCEPIQRVDALIANDRNNLRRIKPFIGGDEVASSPIHAHRRFVIDFNGLPLQRDGELPPWETLLPTEQNAHLRNGIVSLDYPGEVASDFPALLQIVRERVYPIRAVLPERRLRERWWEFERSRPALYSKISPLGRVMVFPSKATPQYGFSMLSSKMIFSQNVHVFSLENLSFFCILSSRIHELWCRMFGTSFKDDLTYVLEDCFETFPFPEDYERNGALEVAGQAYHDHRAALMVAADEGMTKTYNRFHKPEERSEGIRRLRDMHVAMDRAVLEAYGWHDLAAELTPEFLTLETEDDHTYQGRLFWPAEQRDKVLARLLALNAERHAAEVAAGVVPKEKKSATAEGDEPEEEAGSLL